ncbi:hypothetical protein V8F20_010018 [Naviculisporaceae sp. PSN 640]
MASQLPTIPWLVFTVLEPLSLLAGAIPAIVRPEWFISQQSFQLPGSSAAPADELNVTLRPRLVAQQLGNTYLVAATVAFAVLYTTSELKVVRNYLKALWICDIGHLVISFLGLGSERVLAVGDWNPMAWGNIGATLFLFLTRSAYFLGLLGQDRNGQTTRNDEIKKLQ